MSFFRRTKLSAAIKASDWAKTPVVMLLQFGLLYYIATSITHKAHHFVARDRMLPLPMRFPCGY